MKIFLTDPLAEHEYVFNILKDRLDEFQNSLAITKSKINSQYQKNCSNNLRIKIDLVIFPSFNPMCFPSIEARRMVQIPRHA